MVVSCAFDRYFVPEAIRSMDEFWRSKRSDPWKPIVLFGTAGAFTSDRDETFMMDLLLEMTEQAEDLRDVPFSGRFHPCSRLQYFCPTGIILAWFRPSGHT